MKNFFFGGGGGGGGKLSRLVIGPPILFGRYHLHLALMLRIYGVI